MPSDWDDVIFAFVFFRHNEAIHWGRELIVRVKRRGVAFGTALLLKDFLAVLRKGGSNLFGFGGGFSE